MINSLWIDAVHFVASIEVIEAGNVIESIDFTKSNELKLNSEFVTEKKAARASKND